MMGARKESQRFLMPVDRLLCVLNIISFWKLNQDLNHCQMAIKRRRNLRDHLKNKKKREVKNVKGCGNAARGRVGSFLHFVRLSYFAV